MGFRYSEIKMINIAVPHIVSKNMLMQVAIIVGRGLIKLFTFLFVIIKQL